MPLNNVSNIYFFNPYDVFAEELFKAKISGILQSVLVGVLLFV